MCVCVCDVHLLFDVAKTKQKKNWDSLEPERERERNNKTVADENRNNKREEATFCRAFLSLRDYFTTKSSDDSRSK